MYVNSFKDGIEWMLKNGAELDRLLVPDVSDDYRGMVINQKFDRDIENSFWYENPPLHLARRKNLKNSETCATLPVLQNLISDPFIFTYTNNTQESAELCKEGRVDTCVTNQYGLETNDLEVIRKLKSMNVFWVPFKIFK